MQFRKLCMINLTSLSHEHMKRIHLLAEEVFEHKEIPKDFKQAIDWIRDCDGVLISLPVPLDKKVIEGCPHLKYIGMYGTSLHRIAVDEAEAKGIKVTNINDYCDWETAEFVIAQLLNVARGLNKLKWKDQPTTLENKKLGIIGMGQVGHKVAEMALGLKMKVSYFSRARHPEEGAMGVHYKELPKLLKESDMISLHTPPHVEILPEESFNHLGNGKVLINTCIGKNMHQESFMTWIETKGNLAVFDQVSSRDWEEIQNHKNILVYSGNAFDTIEANKNLSDRFVRHMEDHLGH